MKPRQHRKISSNENRAEHDNLFEVAASRPLWRSVACVERFIHRSIFPTSDRYPAYGYPSCHSGGIAIGR